MKTRKSRLRRRSRAVAAMRANQGFAGEEEKTVKQRKRSVLRRRWFIFRAWSKILEGGRKGMRPKTPLLVERDIDPGKKKREEIGNLIRKMSAKRA